jgi:hypothetical protein
VSALEGYDPTHCGDIVDVTAGLRGAPISDIVPAAR